MNDYPFTPVHTPHGDGLIITIQHGRIIVLIKTDTRLIHKSFSPDQIRLPSTRGRGAGGEGI